MSRAVETPGHALRPGMFVETPEWVIDEGVRTRLRDVWPDAPAVLRVVTWEWEEGESLIEDPHRDGGGCIDFNVLDYPPVWRVVDEPTPETVKIARGFKRAGFQIYNTGGGCEAWIRYDGARVLVATRADDASVPERLSEPVLLGTYDRCPDGSLFSDEGRDFVQCTTVAECLARFI